MTRTDGYIHLHSRQNSPGCQILLRTLQHLQTFNLCDQIKNAIKSLPREGVVIIATCAVVSRAIVFFLSSKNNPF